MWPSFIFSKKRPIMGPNICVTLRQQKNPKMQKYPLLLEMPGIEPGAFHMQSERATTALHPLSKIQMKTSQYKRISYRKFICIKILV